MELSLKERDRISVLRQVSEGVLAAGDGAARFGATARRFRRVRRRFEAAGDEVVVHGLRGRRSNRSLSSETRERALARDPDYADFGATLRAEHVELELGVRVSAETVRAWRMGAGLWQRKRKRAKRRSRRPRCAARGELLQRDSSVHAWLEDRGPPDLVLIALHDDATSGFMHGRFVERDTGAANRRAIVERLERHRPSRGRARGPRGPLRPAPRHGGARRPHRRPSPAASGAFGPGRCALANSKPSPDRAVLPNFSSFRKIEHVHNGRLTAAGFRSIVTVMQSWPDEETIITCYAFSQRAS